MSSALAFLLGASSLLSCNGENAHPFQTAESSWTAQPRILAGSLTADQIELATVVVVTATMEGQVVAAKEVRGARSATLRIPRAGTVEFQLQGFRDDARTLLIWSGSCILDPGSPSREAVLTAEAGLRVGKPSFSTPARSGRDSLAIAFVAPSDSSVIRYTLDGSDPSLGSSLLYEDTLVLRSSTRIRAIAVRGNFLPSQETSDSFTVLPGAVPDTVGQPDISVLPTVLGDSVQRVLVSVTTPGAALRYTTDGQDPATSPSAITSLAPDTIDLNPGDTIELRVVAERNGFVRSPERRRRIEVPSRVAPVEVQVEASGKKVLVVLECATSDATVKYTLDGSDPLATGASVYTSGWVLELVETTTIRAVAIQDGKFASERLSRRIDVLQVPDTVVAPEILASALVEEDSLLHVRITSATAGARIRYTLDGQDPATSPTALEVAGDVRLDLQPGSSTPVRALALNTGMVASKETQRSLSVARRVADLVATKVHRSDTTLVVLRTTTPEAIIRYTMDGSDPLGPSASQRNSGDTLRLTSAGKLRAVATLAGWFASRRWSDSISIQADWTWSFDSDTKDSLRILADHGASCAKNPRSSCALEISQGTLMNTFDLHNEAGLAYTGWVHTLLALGGSGPQDLRGFRTISFDVRADSTFDIQILLESPLQVCWEKGYSLGSSTIRVTPVTKSVNISLNAFTFAAWVDDPACTRNLVSTVDSTNAAFSDTARNVAASLTGFRFAIAPTWNLGGDLVVSPVGRRRLHLDNIRILP